MGVSRHPAESNVEMGGAPGESGPSPPLPCGVRPIWIVATGVVLGGMAAAGCGGSQSASPTQRSTSATYVGTDVAWLSSKAEPWNHKLNSDQYAVLAATNASSEDDTGRSLWMETYDAWRRSATSSDHSQPHTRHCKLSPPLVFPDPRTISLGTSTDPHLGHS